MKHIFTITIKLIAGFNHLFFAPLEFDIVIQRLPFVGVFREHRLQILLHSQ